ncbi:MAG: sugar phosphate nucleotidyltransferase [Candidatus Kerfeldbacteria bacterium]|jgi:bifunctional UDP-N-acetylglucosamine pyrophosphorylase / glucosamine-1-phosphate N-acetyltransferase
MSILQHTSVIILAAGKGTRLNEGQPSEIPKVMHKICGKPMLEYSLKTLENLSIDDAVVVVGYKAEVIKEYFGDKFKYALQEEQKGTGHAVACATDKVNPGSKYVLVMQGDDSAFYKPGTIIDLLNMHVKEKAIASVLTLIHPNPAELGRVIRDDNGRVLAIKEKEVLTEEEKKINEINAATYCFNADWLWENIKNLQPSATGKGELILPDLIKMAVDQKGIVCAHAISDLDQWVGVNTPEQLELANEIMTKRLA